MTSPWISPPEGVDPSTRSSSSFSSSWWKSQAFVFRFSIRKSHIRISWAFLCFSDVITVLCSTLRCRSWLSSPSSNIAAMCRLGPLFACCLVAAVLGLGPLCHCCTPGPSNVSSQTSVLSGFLWQIYSWSDSSAIPVRPTVLHDCVPKAACVPCAVPLLHSGSSSCQV
jgi:hypothetical protein